MRRYETVFVLRPDTGENQLKQSIKRIEDIVGHGGGELIETDEWGMRELAYRIKRERRGYYVRLDYVSEAAVMNEVERNLKLMDEVLRYLSVLVSVEADAAALRGELEARQRRIAEARAAALAAAEPKLVAEPEPAPAAVAEPASAAPTTEEPTPPTEAEGGAEQS